jgi:hypothetical protein
MIMDKELKDIYYIAKRNMNKFIKHKNKYYRIVGFYCQYGYKGYLVTCNSKEFGYNYMWWKNQKGITEIFLNKHNRSRYTYGLFTTRQLERDDYDIVDNKDE